MAISKELQKKVDFAIRLLQQAEISAKSKGQPVEIAYSGGKDSDVLLELAKMANIKFRAIYKNTSIDPPYTIKHCKENGVEIMPPKLTFLELLKNHGFPTRFRRFCCGYLKEYKILDVSAIGVRRSESKKRSERYKEPTQCRFYGKKKSEHVEQFFPILEWDDNDVEQFIKERNIQCHPLYYDEQGKFHVEKRLGCMCCPLISRKKRIKQFMLTPNMVKLYAIGGGYFFDNHDNKKVRERFNNVYEWICMDLFCESLQDFQNKFGKNLFNKGVDCKKFLEDYFNIKFD